MKIIDGERLTLSTKYEQRHMENYELGGRQ